MTIEIYAMTKGKYHDCKRYVSAVFCDYITYTEWSYGTWFTAFVGSNVVFSGEVSDLHGKGNKTLEFIRDLR